MPLAARGIALRYAKPADLDHVAAQGVELADYAMLIAANEPSKPGGIRCQDRDRPTLGTRSAHGLLPLAVQSPKFLARLGSAYQSRALDDSRHGCGRMPS